MATPLPSYQGPVYPPMGPFPLHGIPNPIISQPSSEATLYVGNLSPVTDEMRLHGMFSPYGSLSNSKVMRDLYTSISRRFGFVSFATVDEAQKAKEALNYTKIDNFEIRICFKKITSEFKEGANLFIKNIDKKASTKQLDELFSKYGKVVSCSIRTDDKGESLGYGYIQYESEESAEAAREKLNGNTSFGQAIKVEKFVSSKNRETVKNNLYFKNFPKSWDQDRCTQQIKDLFGAHGTIVSSDVKPKTFSDGVTRFSGFCAMETQESAKLILEKYNNTKLEGSAEDEEPFYVAIAESKNARATKLKKEFIGLRNTTNLYVKSILETVTEEQLRSAFSKYGEITSLMIGSSQPPFIPNGQTVKYAFINFKNEKMATEVLLSAKKDADLKALIHPAHKKTIDFIVYHQSKASRMEYLRMKQRLQQSLHFGSMGGMMNMNFPGNFKKNAPFGAMQNMQMFPYAQYPNQGRGMPGYNRNMPGMNARTPPIGEHLPSSSTSRQGEDEEVFNLEYLKSHKSEFLGYDKERQNNILGNLMYHKVMESGLSNKDLAPKITGMLIDMDILDLTEIIEIMENKESLNERVNEALDVINTNED